MPRGGWHRCESRRQGHRQGHGQNRRQVRSAPIRHWQGVRSGYGCRHRPAQRAPLRPFFAFARLSSHFFDFTRLSSRFFAFLRLCTPFFACLRLYTPFFDFTRLSSTLHAFLRLYTPFFAFLRISSTLHAFTRPLRKSITHGPNHVPSTPTRHVPFTTRASRVTSPSPRVTYPQRLRALFRHAHVRVRHLIGHRFRHRFFQRPPPHTRTSESSTGLTSRPGPPSEPDSESSRHGKKPTRKAADSESSRHGKKPTRKEAEKKPDSERSPTRKEARLGKKPTRKEARLGCQESLAVPGPAHTRTRTQTRARKHECAHANKGVRPRDQGHSGAPAKAHSARTRAGRVNGGRTGAAARDRKGGGPQTVSRDPSAVTVSRVPPVSRDRQP
jgi:hypothetical protein